MRMNENKYKPISYSNVIMCMKLNENNKKKQTNNRTLYGFSRFAKASKETIEIPHTYIKPHWIKIM